MEYWVGTSGYSYKEWKGSFYPEKLPAKDMLQFYGTQLSSVEINNTFYRMPTGKLLTGWLEQVPEQFRFSIKASRKITHFKRLKGVEEEMEYLFRTLETMGPRLGVVLFQLPPNFKKDLERLEGFMKLLPNDRCCALEFRHDSWFSDDVYEALRSHGSALCYSDRDEELDLPFVNTAEWGYLRLRQEQYSPKELNAWVRKIEEQKWKQAFVFFKHEDSGSGPALAKRFLDSINATPRMKR